MTEVESCVTQSAKEYTITFKTTNYEYYKLMRQLAYMMMGTDRKGSKKSGGDLNV